MNPEKEVPAFETDPEIVKAISERLHWMDIASYFYQEYEKANEHVKELTAYIEDKQNISKPSKTT